MQIKDVNLVEKLQKSGFSDKEAKIYVSTLELGGGYPSKIAEYSGLNRSTTYQVLLNLSIRGLVNEIEKRNKIFYQVEKPEKVVTYAKGQIRIAEDRFEQMKSVLSDIEGLYGALGTRPKITYYEGKEGIVSIYQDHLDFKKPYEMLAWANGEDVAQFFPAGFLDQYGKTKEKIGITTRGILPDTSENRNYTSVHYKNVSEKSVPGIRYVKPDQFPLMGEIVIYGENKVSIVNLEKNTPIGTIIEDKAIHRLMKTIFELSWESKLVKE